VAASALLRRRVIFYITRRLTVSPAPIESCRFFASTIKPPDISRIPFEGTESAASLENALAWLRHCALDHPQCGPCESQKLPSRVLNIKKDPIFLYETKNELARYACISHCWGPPSDSPMLRTLKTTIARHKEEVPWQLLPRSFQDAISFARRLGLAWIWIDSLCIIQDDPLDWKKEAAQMASIYQNAYVTLGATKSSHSNGGLFNRKGERIQDSIKSPLKLVVNGHKAAIYAGAYMDHVTQYPRPMEHTEKSPFPLLERAWVYQERLLSPRFLHFAPYELNWECRESFKCECGGTVNYASDPKTKIRSQLSAYRVGSEEVDRLSLWRWLVGEYSRLSITYGKDVFPALAGLAQRWNLHGTDQYLAGLWRSSFVHDLLWKTEDWRVEAERPFPWRAPTWSCASVFHAPISYPAQLSIKHVHADIVEVNCIPTGLDRKGEISSAYLVLSAKYLPGAAFYLDKSKDSMLESKVLFSHFRCILSIKTKDGMYSPHPGFTPDIPTREKLPPSPVKVIMIADMERSGQISRAFLVLKEREDESDTYERFGMLTLESGRNIGCIEAYGEASRQVGGDVSLQEGAKEIGSKMTEGFFREFEEQPMRTFKIL
jgi:hypothetical protein